MDCEIDGSLIENERDFHREIARAVGFNEYYGNNLDALWDTLSSDVERPVMLVWKNSRLSKQRLGGTFDKIVGVLLRVKLQDERWEFSGRFNFMIDEGEIIEEES